MRPRLSVLLFLILFTTIITWLQVGYVSQRYMIQSMHEKEPFKYWGTKERSKRNSDGDQPVPAPSVAQNEKGELLTSEKKRLYHANAAATFKKLGKHKILESNGKYVLPVLFFDVGPNNLYRVFKESIPLVIAMNRTMVIPPFHRHPRMENFLNKKSRVARDSHGLMENIIEVPIFDQTYAVSMETNPDKTMDTKSLKYIVPTESMERFADHCNKRVDSVLVCGDVDTKRVKGIQLFWNATKLKSVNKIKVETLREVAEEKNWKINLKRAMDKMKNDRCAGLVIGRGCLGKKDTWLKSWKNVAPFVRRPLLAQTMAREFIENIFNNEDFIAIHWRYDKIDWNDMCKASRPMAARNKNEKICDLSLQLDADNEILYRLGSKISDFMASKNITKSYISFPPQMNETMHRLRQHTPGLYTLYDVKEFSKQQYTHNSIFDTNYMISFVEQEICHLSSFFLASPLSSWSQSVLLDFMAEERKTYASVLDILADDYQGFPKLTWLFPEGNWT